MESSATMSEVTIDQFIPDQFIVNFPPVLFENVECDKYINPFVFFVGKNKNSILKI